MVRQLNGDSFPARAVDRIVDGGFMELEGGAADAVWRGRKALGLNELPGIRPVETREVMVDNSQEEIDDLTNVKVTLWGWVKLRYFYVSFLFPVYIYKHNEK